jgi:hypothetical protein
MPIIRAKMRCTRKVQATSASAYGEPKPVDTEDVEFQPVSGPGNEEWSKWTPSGLLKMQINNPQAVGGIEVGKDYFIDISLVG